LTSIDVDGRQYSIPDEMNNVLIGINGHDWENGSMSMSTEKLPETGIEISFSTKLFGIRQEMCMTMIFSDVSATSTARAGEWAG
jgi:hypothetical protein